MTFLIVMSAIVYYTIFDARKSTLRDLFIYTITVNDVDIIDKYNMNYTKIYCNLIENAKQSLNTGYIEIHHIIPKCMGGTDDGDNLIKLTPEEHFLAHQLLVKMYPDNKKLIYALSAMCMSADSKKMIRNNKMFGWIKRKISESRTGVPRSDETKQKLRDANLGKKATEETRQKIREKANGRVLTEEHKQNISKGQLGKVVSDETKENISKSLIGRNKGKSYEEIYGAEMAEKLKKNRSDSQKGRPKSEDHRKKLSNANKGKSPTKETRAKISEGNKGKITSEETKRKISESKISKQRIKMVGLLTGSSEIPVHNS